MKFKLMILSALGFLLVLLLVTGCCGEPSAKQEEPKNERFVTEYIDKHCRPSQKEIFFDKETGKRYLVVKTSGGSAVGILEIK